MPNATCFLVAYLLLLVLELIRGRYSFGKRESLLKAIGLGGAAFSLFTHSLYLLDRLFLGIANDAAPLYLAWHDWGILSSWLLACVYVWMTFQRPETRVGVFLIPPLLLLIGLSIMLPADVTPGRNSASGWRLAHGVAMMIGTMLVSLGMAIAIMYFVQSSRLKNFRQNRYRWRLPSLEYLETFGRRCLLGSAASIGLGLVFGVIMNFAKDGRVEWTDQGILFSAGLFLWLALASFLQWYLSKRGQGRSMASMNLISFLIVATALALVLRTPHGGNLKPIIEPMGPHSESPNSIEKDAR
jgi:hypothetical protein